MQRPEDFIGFIVFGIVFVVLSVNVSASPSYQRDEYISSWVDEDGDCQNLRHEIQPSPPKGEKNRQKGKKNGQNKQRDEQQVS